MNKLNLLKSCAGFTVFIYVLGISHRNSNNIKIT